MVYEHSPVYNILGHYTCGQMTYSWADPWLVLTEEGVPTSVDFVRCEPSQMVAAYTSCHTYIYDVETAKQVIKLDTKQTNGMYHSFACVTDVHLCICW